MMSLSGASSRLTGANTGILIGALTLDCGDPIPCVPFPLLRGRGGNKKRGEAPLGHPAGGNRGYYLQLGGW